MRPDRIQIEQSIAEAGQILKACVELIRDHTPIADWPESVRQAFLVACFGASDAEKKKEAALQWHLFRGDVFGLVGRYGPDNYVSERIRADLIGLVRLGAGRHILSELVAAEENAPQSGQPDYRR